MSRFVAAVLILATAIPLSGCVVDGGGGGGGRGWCYWHPYKCHR